MASLSRRSNEVFYHVTYQHGKRIWRKSLGYFVTVGMDRRSNLRRECEMNQYGAVGATHDDASGACISGGSPSGYQFARDDPGKDSHDYLPVEFVMCSENIIPSKRQSPEGSTE
jgi:hypothetical protein